MSELRDNVTELPLSDYFHGRADLERLGETEESYELSRAEIREVLAGFLAVPTPGQASSTISAIEYELVETKVGTGVRTRLPGDKIDTEWGFLVCANRPHARYLELRQRFIDESVWEVRDTVPADARVLARAAQENARLVAVIAGVDKDVFLLLFS